MIELITMKDGRVIMDKCAKAGVTVGEICEIAENEFYGGYADHVKVIVDDNVYMELES